MIMPFYGNIRHLFSQVWFFHVGVVLKQKSLMGWQFSASFLALIGVHDRMQAARNRTPSGTRSTIFIGAGWLLESSPNLL